MSKTQHGTVTIELGGEQYELKPTLKAALAIERQFGGLTAALRAVPAGSIEQVAFIVQHGAGLGTKREITDAIQQKVFEAGVLEIGPHVVEYISALLNPAGKEADEGNAPTA